ncbi:hypothetical protein PDESU_01263 [Pontiella desulfatans]|uniref:Uncharacterized protein n=1 Tax=Pontiella desulfatans TaxID=2750659 RepID=A0A6C2TYP2_PONDE|nr:hypothetical protein [Pontiella desulfatans]VGO12709.1 hypothetical protein PDESU_01263 [Pontiella desulfatans]
MKDLENFVEDELKTFIEEWISNLNLDGEDEVGSAMAETMATRLPTTINTFCVSSNGAKFQSCL